MPDKTIGALPQVPSLDDSSLMVVEQQGQAMKMTGAQFKEFGKQGLVADMQGYVDKAQQAADSAQGAVDAVLDMTVEAHSLENSQNATVSKSRKDGVFNLDFGLPRGPEGKQGPEGKEGQRGPKGDPGSGLTILGYYPTALDLETAQPFPQPGDAYGVGTEAPYDIYVYDGVSLLWKNNGPLSGGGGGIVPENVVTAEGGAAMLFTGLGGPPFSVEFVDEEEPPLTAADITYQDESVEEALSGLFTSVSSGKARIASAITDKGVPTQEDASFADMAENIRRIPTGTGTGDATATPGDILSPKTAYTATGKVEGVIPTLAGRTITPGTGDQMIANGQYLGGSQIIKGDPNLTSANIKKGVSIFGVAGAVEQTFLATLTVTVDVGAVVTARNGSTEVSALSTTGSVTLELPIEGQWTVTAVRGVTQYNTVTVTVTSRYTAELTAQLHIEYWGRAEELSSARTHLAATTVGDYALFGGGSHSNSGGAAFYVDAYNHELTHSVPEPLESSRLALSAAHVGKYALFAGGVKYYGSDGAGITDMVDAYNEELTRSAATVLSLARSNAAGAAIGNYALFGGGSNAPSTHTAVVDAYDSALTRTTPTPLIKNESCKAASNASYAMIFGTKASAYDTSLTRSLPAVPNTTKSLMAAARAGSYILFTYGSSQTLAYDLFLTRTEIEGLASGGGMGGTTLKDYALFFGSVTNKEAGATAYDPYLVRTTIKVDYYNLPVIRTSGAAVAIDKYALFGGGFFGGSNLRTKNVDVFQYK